jgi:hypothetical protein
LPPQPLSWPIERRDSKGAIRGRSRAIFLHHQLPHFARIDVYSDGLIKYGDGLNGYDFGSFANATHRGDISTFLRTDAALLFEARLSGLGTCQVDDFNSLVTADDLIAWTRTTIDELNPGATDLLDFEGVEYEDIDPRQPGIRRFRTVLAAWADYVRYDEASRKITGKPYRVVVHENGEWLITDWMIYADGASQLGPTGAIVNFRDVVAYARAGRVTSSVPDGQWINMDGLGLLKPKNASWWISPDGLICEAEDILARLQGKEGIVSFCLRALRSHVENPSPESLDFLREAYDLIPTHMREPELGRDEHSIRSKLGLPPVSHTDNDYSSVRK